MAIGSRRSSPTLPAAAAVFSLPITDTPTFFGMDQMEVAGSKLYVSQPNALEIFDANTGAFLSSIVDPSIVLPTGVCFPSR